ncbi:hypothetical protein [Secundilactobacillus paracollinoides]|uniref:Surface layer protein A domain-containing protein n=1 Tax=Secundilactobacillus paracollinoides TaxID=240427 RepID=A0A1B2IY85_9LACO|nr:hypothetical protein [Secundilactobacillus paracollinoides]ANZ61089.1 hypothetical protein AYR61_06865 [Secundilactobacillus paracollinoides]ANZ67012.1 hypothetical protein AYR63_07620 [Secundilactobacillus paracollinoides]
MIKKVTVGVAFVVASSLFAVRSTVQAKTSSYKVLSNKAVSKQTFIHYKNKKSYVWNYLPKTTKKAHKTHNLWNYKKTNFVVTRKAKVSNMGTYYKIKGSMWTGWISSKDVLNGKVKVTNQQTTVVSSRKPVSDRSSQTSINQTATTQPTASQTPTVQQPTQAQSDTTSSNPYVEEQIKEYGWSGQPIVLDRNATALNDVAIPDAIKGQTFATPNDLRTILYGLEDHYSMLLEQGKTALKPLEDEYKDYERDLSKSSTDSQVITNLKGKQSAGIVLTKEEETTLYDTEKDKEIQDHNVNNMKNDMETLNSLERTLNLYQDNYDQISYAIDKQIWK